MTTTHSGRRDIAIINRSFWPIYPVIGEALLRFSEKLAGSYSVSVILQDHVGIRKHLAERERGEGVEFLPGKAWSNSSSGILVRVLDSVYFMCWVIYALLRTRPKNVYVSADPRSGAFRCDALCPAVWCPVRLPFAGYSSGSGQGSDEGSAVGVSTAALDGWCDDAPGAGTDHHYR